MWTHHGNSRQEQAPIMNTLTSCVNKAVVEGYTECFKITARGLYAISKSRYYRPEQLQSINTYRFEGQGDPENNVNIYVIETSDGLKGTLIDAYSTYCDVNVNNFMTEAEEIRKKIARHNQHEC